MLWGKHLSPKDWNDSESKGRNSTAFESRRNIWGIRLYSAEAELLILLETQHEDVRCYAFCYSLIEDE